MHYSTCVPDGLEFATVGGGTARVVSSWRSIVDM
jgi:hypothetical protein